MATHPLSFCVTQEKPARGTWVGVAVAVAGWEGGWETGGGGATEAGAGPGPAAEGEGEGEGEGVVRLCLQGVCKARLGGDGRYASLVPAYACVEDGGTRRLERLRVTVSGEGEG